MPRYPNETFDRIRALPTCPNCREKKSAGLILCWPCHHSHKARNDGCYSPRLERKLAAMEQALEQAEARP